MQKKGTVKKPLYARILAILNERGCCLVTSSSAILKERGCCSVTSSSTKIVELLRHFHAKLVQRLNKELVCARARARQREQERGVDAICYEESYQMRKYGLFSSSSSSRHKQYLYFILFAPLILVLP